MLRQEIAFEERHFIRDPAISLRIVFPEMLVGVNIHDARISQFQP
jgi:hypothetical protein